MSEFEFDEIVIDDGEVISDDVETMSEAKLGEMTCDHWREDIDLWRRAYERQRDENIKLVEKFNALRVMSVLASLSGLAYIIMCEIAH